MWSRTKRRRRRSLANTLAAISKDDALAPADLEHRCDCVQPSCSKLHDCSQCSVGQKWKPAREFGVAQRDYGSVKSGERFAVCLRCRAKRVNQPSRSGKRKREQSVERQPEQSAANDAAAPEPMQIDSDSLTFALATGPQLSMDQLRELNRSTAARAVSHRM